MFLNQLFEGHNMLESRIMDRNAMINAYYVSAKGDKHKVAENIPYYLLDKLVPLLTKKYAITMNDIEVKPVDVTQYRRTSQPELAEAKYKDPKEADYNDDYQDMVKRVAKQQKAKPDKQPKK